MNVLQKHIDDFLKGRAALAKTTLSNYHSTLTRFAELYPAWPIDPLNIAAFYSQEGMSETSQRQHYQRFKAFCNWLLKTGRVKVDPLADLTAPALPGLLPRVPKTDDLQALIDYLEKRMEALIKEPRFRHCGYDGWVECRDLAIYSLMIDCGLRVSEVCRLRVDDLDLQEDSLLIARSKNKRQRYVMFGRKVKGNLKLWLRLRAARLKAIGKTSEALFINQYGRAIGPKDTQRRLQDICNELGTGVITCHRLRHAYAVHSLRNGANLEMIRQQLGHSSITITARYLMMPSTGRLKAHQATSPLDHLEEA